MRILHTEMTTVSLAIGLVLVVQNSCVVPRAAQADTIAAIHVMSIACAQCALEFQVTFLGSMDRARHLQCIATRSQFCEH